VYIPVLQQAGFVYSGVEPDKEIAVIANVLLSHRCFIGTYEDFQTDREYDLIFCAHAFEHMQDSPGMMAKAFSQLKSGGRLVLIVPNDEDKCNPDHLFFYNERSLRSVLMRIGFQDIRMVSRRRVPHEEFIYCSCVKP
jgi:trans-aconitate methyltransferase